jgi:hypothetical protein
MRRDSAASPMAHGESVPGCRTLAEATFLFFESELIFRNAYNGIQSKSCYIFPIALHHLFFWLMLVELKEISDHKSDHF